MARLVKVLTVMAVVAAFALPSTVAGAATTTVTMAGTLNTPAVVVVNVGDVIKFTNAEPTNYPAPVYGKHDVMGDKQVADATGLTKFPGVSPTLLPGASWSWTVPAGTSGKKYAYHCSVHPNQQKGIIVVQ